MKNWIGLARSVFLVFLLFYHATMRWDNATALSLEQEDVQTYHYIFYYTSHVGFFPSQCQVGWFVDKSLKSSWKKKNITYHVTKIIQLSYKLRGS